MAATPLCAEEQEPAAAAIQSTAQTRRDKPKCSMNQGQKGGKHQTYVSGEGVVVMRSERNGLLGHVR
jgi:hypothetical protein